VLIFIGAMQAFGVYGALPLIGLLIIGAFLYFVINKSFMLTNESSESIEYLGVSHKVGYALLLFFMFLFGILPSLLLGLVKL
ncbi:MAG: hypothetical protein M1474_01655, partial [Candidatus Marsarchaeota archaeon]|nr:hypothetical protein [Candidatus Marsarchaeota archaeon]